MGWAYRRFIIKLAGISPQAEAEYAADHINTNFSNYSAWHARTTLLHAVHAEAPTLSLTQLLAAHDSSSAGDAGDLLISRFKWPQECQATHAAAASWCCEFMPS